MPLPCILCNAPNRREIEEKLATGALTHREAAKLLNCGRASVTRHVKNHLRTGLRAAIVLSEKESPHLANGLNVAKQLERSHSDCLALFREALARGSIKEALRALEVEIKQLQLSAKIQGVYTDAPQLNILMTPEFVRLKQVLVESLEDYPEALPAVSARLDRIIEDYSLENGEQE